MDAHAQDLINQLRWSWLDAAWSTARANRPRAEESVLRLYRAARLDRPTIVWVESPQALAATAAALRALDSVDGSVPPLPEASVRALARLRDEVGPCLFRSDLTPVLWQNPSGLSGDTVVPAAVRWQVADALTATDAPYHVAAQGRRVWQRAAESAGVRPGDVAALSAESCCLDAILWDAYLAVCGLRDRVIERTLSVLRGVGWFAPFDQLALLADRPVNVSFGPGSLLAADRQFHAVGRPAIRWNDSEELNWWNGVELPSGFWRWTLADVAACADPAWRRIALDHLDPGSVSGQLEPLAVADDPANPGRVIELYELPVAGGGSIKFVRVTNASPDMDSTFRRFLLHVPPTATDPLAAVADSFGVDAETYRALVRAG